MDILGIIMILAPFMLLFFWVCGEEGVVVAISGFLMIVGLVVWIVFAIYLMNPDSFTNALLVDN